MQTKKQNRTRDCPRHQPGFHGLTASGDPSSYLLLTDTKNNMTSTVHPLPPPHSLLSLLLIVLFHFLASSRQPKCPSLVPHLVLFPRPMTTRQHQPGRLYSFLNLTLSVLTLYNYNPFCGLPHPPIAMWPRTAHLRPQSPEVGLQKYNRPPDAPLPQTIHTLLLQLSEPPKQFTNSLHELHIHFSSSPTPTSLSNVPLRPSR